MFCSITADESGVVCIMYLREALASSGLREIRALLWFEGKQVRRLSPVDFGLLDAVDEPQGAHNVHGAGFLEGGGFDDS